MTWTEAFVWTLALELPVYAALLRGRMDRAEFFVATLCGNLITHPIVWCAIDRFDSYRVGWYALESFATVVEAAVIHVVSRKGGRPISVWRSLAVSVAANLTSSLVGPWVLRMLA